MAILNLAQWSKAIADRFESMALRIGKWQRTLAKRIFLILAAGGILWLVGNWIWYSPYLVARRIEPNIRLGMASSEMSTMLQSGRSFEMPSSAYCAPSTSQNFQRLSTYTPGGVGFLLMSIPTTVTFCYDVKDRLVAYKIARWIDGP